LFTRDYIFVEDVVDAYLALADGCAKAGVCGEAFNFSPESQVSVLEITAVMQRLMKREDLAPQILDQVKAEIRDQYLDSSRARQRLGWTARHTLEQGMGKTIAWYRTFLDASLKQPAAHA
jgi:CDP-glucose 4,6-dehydratase